jgi:hypothetical protein
MLGWCLFCSASKSLVGSNCCSLCHYAEYDDDDAAAYDDNLMMMETSAPIVSFFSFNV